MKIAIVGTGSGWELAPFGHPEWEIWTIPGLWKTPHKFSRVYEIHSAENRIRHGLSKEKLEWIREEVTVCHPTLLTTCRNARAIEFERLIDKYGPYFTNSISWMIAEAIEETPEEISIFGVTMSSQGEYGHQKPSCSYLIGWARAKGIKVSVQKGAELMSAPYIYGYQEKPDFLVSLADTKLRCLSNMAEAESTYNEAKAKYNHAEGYKECLQDIENNFYSATKSMDNRMVSAKGS